MIVYTKYSGCVKPILPDQTLALDISKQNQKNAKQNKKQKKVVTTLDSNLRSVSFAWANFNDVA